MNRGAVGRTPGQRLACAARRGRSAIGPTRQDRIVSSVKCSISKRIRSSRAGSGEGNASRLLRTCRPLSSGCWGRLRTTSGPGSGGFQNADVGPQPHPVREIRRSTCASRFRRRARCLPGAPGYVANPVVGLTRSFAAPGDLNGKRWAPPRPDQVRPKPSAGIRTSIATPSHGRRSIPAGAAARLRPGIIEPRYAPVASGCSGACISAPRPRILARGHVPAESRRRTGCPRTKAPGFPLEQITSPAFLALVRRPRA